MEPSVYVTAERQDHGEGSRAANADCLWKDAMFNDMNEVRVSSHLVLF